MPPSVISLAVPVRQVLVNKVVECVSAHFSGNRRKMCYVHAEVGFFLVATCTYRIRQEPISILSTTSKNVLDRCDSKR